ncbi:DUF5455 family protein [Salinicola avicenniae]|uniref:DUF5455 family protein n=1 Tax=Salinicola avicenniae TaxID=2916836 RepID=UPI002072A936|nr:MULTISPECIES: DUF5455 family protein [unclassified Salinicola]
MIRWIGVLLVKILDWILSKFAGRLAGRLATSLGWITFYIAMLAALAGVIAALVAGLSTTLPSDLARGLALVKPRNLEVCISAIYSTKVALWVFRQKKQILEWEQMRSFV